MKQYGFYINTDSCVGCKTCEIACKDHKNLPVGVRIRKVREYGGGKWVNKDGFLMPSDVFNYYVSMSCMHCANPACLENCPVNAITRDEEYGAVGAMYYDRDNGWGFYGDDSYTASGISG